MTVWFCSCFYSYLFFTLSFLSITTPPTHQRTDNRVKTSSNHGSRVSPGHAIICHQIPSTLSQIPSLQSFLADLRSRSPSMSRKRSRAPHRTLEELLKFMLASLHCFTPRISTTWKLHFVFIALRIHIFPPISQGILWIVANKWEFLWLCNKLRQKFDRISLVKSLHPWPMWHLRQEL